MARIRPLEYDETGPEIRPEYDKQISAHGRMTNMKKTLARVPTAFRALMEWYSLHAEVVPFLGSRTTFVFAHAISAQTDCLICSTFFRRILIEGGENPDALQLDETERLLVEYGRKLAIKPNDVSDELYARLAARFTPEQIVALTAFAGLMIATNVFNNALRVDLDEYLFPYRKNETTPRER
ncbi:MAG: hypothetical protein U1D30_10755 [Planctomycetota bacterium]